jgi:putative ABC transport system permease protein
MSFQNLRVAIRHLRKSPGFTATAVLMLGLGIGATTAIFSIVEGVLLRPLPFPQPDRVVSLSDILAGAAISGNGETGVTATDIRNYTRDTHSFQNLGGYAQVGYELSGVGEPAQILGTRMSGGVFPALGVAPLLGRVFTQPEEDRGEPVVVLSYAMWQNRIHGDPRTLGKKILLDRKPYTIIGVMPRQFEFPLMPGHMNNSELWLPMSFAPQESTGASQANWNFSMVGRLKPGVTVAEAQQDAQRVATETMRNYPSFMSSLHIQASVKSLHEETVYQARDLVRILFFAILVVLLMACANLAGLLLVRAIRRRREIALRLALGAGAGALLGQHVLEGLVLSLGGGLLGLALAAAGLRVGISQLPETLPRIDEIGLDWQVVAFALALSIVTGIGCALAPGFAAWRTSLNETLKEGGRTGTAGGGHAWLRSSLVVGEIATALVLLAGAGLLLRSFEKVQQVNLGFHPDHVLAASYSLPAKQYATQGVIDQFNREMVDRLRHLPGVKFSGVTTYLPALGNSGNTTFVVEGYVPPKGANMDLATMTDVEGDYLQAMGIPLLAGRLLVPSDDQNSPLVVIVNRKLAEHYWPGVDPIGKRLRIGTQESVTPWMTVVGEVADVKEGSPDAADKEQWYQPVEQQEKSLGSFGSPTDLNGNSGFVVVRTAVDPAQMTHTLRETVRSIDPQLALAQIQTMESAISDSEAPRKFQTAIITAFALAAVLLAGLGIYSVIAFSAALRAQEMAIRIALGSQRSGILGLVFVSAIKLAIAGCAIGLAGAAATAHLLDSFLFDVRPFDPVVFAAACMFVLLLALGASWLPAQRAAAADPMKALRAD